MCFIDDVYDVLEDFCFSSVDSGAGRSMRNLFGRPKKGLCSLFVCYWCCFTVYRRFILPREIVDNRYPMCEALYWYPWTLVFEELEQCTCYVHSCNSCGKILGVDFLQRVGAEISLTAQSLFIGRCSFPLKSQGPEV